MSSWGSVGVMWLEDPEWRIADRILEIIASQELMRCSIIWGDVEVGSKAKWERPKGPGALTEVARAVRKGAKSIVSLVGPIYQEMHKVIVPHVDTALMGDWQLYEMGVMIGGVEVWDSLGEDGGTEYFPAVSVSLQGEGYPKHSQQILLEQLRRAAGRAQWPGDSAGDPANRRVYATWGN